VPHARAGGILAEIIVAAPVAGRPDRPRCEATAAVGADVAQHLLDAGGAERALVAADAGLDRGRRQRLGAMFAAWPQLEHQVSRAAASALALRRLSSRGAMRS